MAYGTEYKSYQFGDTEFVVPTRYEGLSARGFGAQGAVWWVLFVASARTRNAFSDKRFPRD